MIYDIGSGYISDHYSPIVHYNNINLLLSVQSSNNTGKAKRMTTKSSTSKRVCVCVRDVCVRVCDVCDVCMYVCVMCVYVCVVCVVYVCVCVCTGMCVYG